MSAPEARTAVLIPWQGDCPHRVTAREWVLKQYAEHHPDWQVVIGSPADDSVWRKGEAVESALVQTDADIIVVADADCWTPGLGDLVRKLRGRKDIRWGMAHTLVIRFTEAATALILDGTPPEDLLLETEMLVQPPYVGYEGGGVVAVKREAYDVAPIDKRFAGFGQEDEAWALALRCTAGDPWRSPLPLWHLWHPPQPRVDRHWGSDLSRRLYEEYLDAYLAGRMAEYLRVTRVTRTPAFE